MRALLLVVVVSASGCAPVAGDSCSPPGGGLCDPSGVGALICERGFLVGYACPGANGCATNPSTKGIMCDVRGVPVGAACPSVFNGVGYCSDSKTFVTCKADPKGGGGLVDVAQAWHFVAQACSTCTASGLAATCTP